MIDNKDFKGVWIPKQIWTDTRLNCLEKVILVEICNLDNGERGCWASNQYFADFCQCSTTKVSTTIKKLIEYGYLYQESFDGRTRVLKSSLLIFEKQSFGNCEADSQNLKPNNIDNNTSNNTMKEDTAAKRKRFIPPTLEEVEAFCLERINNVDPQKFFDYYTATDWCDSSGKKVKSWKQKIIAWESYSNDKKTVRATGVSIANNTSKLDKIF